MVCLRNNLACSGSHRRSSLCSASSMYRCGYAFVGGPCEERRCRRIPRRRFTDRPRWSPLRNNLACSGSHRRSSLCSASSMYRCGYAFVGGPCEERRCRRISRRRFTDRPRWSPLRNNLACSGSHRRSSLCSASSMYRCGYAFVGGPCEERRCRRIPRRRFTDRPRWSPLRNNLACSGSHRRSSLCSASSMYRCGYAFVGGPCEERRCRRISRRRFTD